MAFGRTTLGATVTHDILQKSKLGILMTFVIKSIGLNVILMSVLRLNVAAHTYKNMYFCNQLLNI